MNVEERTFGLPLTPEVRATVRTVLERSFARLAPRVDHVQVRLLAVRDSFECRLVLRPHSGATLAVVETRESMIEALIASATGLARELQRRCLAKNRRSREQRANHRRRAKTAA
jgi:hypothetical protein